MVQVPRGGIPEPQVLVWLKSDAFVPVMLMPANVTVLYPVFVSVMLCAALLVATTWSANFRLDFEIETVGTCNRIAPGIAMSSLPSPLKSPTATGWETNPNEEA